MKKDEERERERILDSPEQLVCVDITRLMHPTAYCAAIPRKVSICKEKHSAWQLQTSGCGSIILYRNNRVGKKRWPGAQATAFLIAVKHTHTTERNRVFDKKNCGNGRGFSSFLCSADSIPDGRSAVVVARFDDSCYGR